MTRILIPTYLRDIHATMIAAALRARGQEAVLWHGADFPTRQKASVHFSKTGSRWKVEGPDLDLSSADRFDVVWYRRPILEPVLPEDIHPGDRIISRHECMAFTGGLWEMVSPDAFWINPRKARPRANSKLAQLEEALALGLDVPLSLCSNDPDEIRRFLRENEGNVVYKPFTPALWSQGEQVAMVFTSEVSVDELPDDDILQLTPGIFQRRIPKAYELRLTYLGNFLVAAKLLSQESEDSQLDWKGAFTRLKVEPVVIPDAVDRLCRRFMERLGLVFGCLDLIVTPEGDYVFLEVNEMGQFLWVEELNPEIRILEPFCELLIQKSADFRWHPSPGGLRFADFYEESLRRQEEIDAHLHVEKLMAHVVQEAR